MESVTLEHIDPRNGILVSGLCNEYNEILASPEYNARKTNRFVPYRVCGYPAPVTFGDIDEFLIAGDWVVCEFGGPDWWEESNRVGNSSTRGGKTTTAKYNSERVKHMNSHPRTKEMVKMAGVRAVERNLGIHNPEYKDSAEYIEQKVQNGKNSSGGRDAFLQSKGIHSEEYKSSEERKKTLRQNAKTTSSQKWMSTVDGFISTAGAVAMHNRGIGVDPSARVRIY